MVVIQMRKNNLYIWLSFEAIYLAVSFLIFLPTLVHAERFFIRAERKVFLVVLSPCTLQESPPRHRLQ